MPNETKIAVQWAITQEYIDFDGNTQQVNLDNPIALVDAVRKYFNDNNITYSTFSYDDLTPYL